MRLSVVRGVSVVIVFDLWYFTFSEELAILFRGEGRPAASGRRLLS